MAKVEDADGDPGVQANSHRDEMVGALSRYLTKHRLVTITKMALAGWDAPTAVNGVFPEVEGVTEFVGSRVFGTAEECETYAQRGARERLDALSRVPGASVFVVVPKACFAAAREHLQAEFRDRDITVLPYGKG